METHDFYRQYANLPLGKRMIPLGAPENGFLQRNMDDIYRRMKKLDDTMRHSDREYLRDVLIADIDEAINKESTRGDARIGLGIARGIVRKHLAVQKLLE